MITKLYEKIKENIFIFLQTIFIFVLALFLSFYKLPYYVDIPGGVINVFDKIDVNNPNTGTLSMPYVSELRATIPIFLYAKINDKWDILEKEEVVASNETENDSILRSKLLLKEANNSAVIYSFKKAGQDIDVTYHGVYVTYVFEEIANTDLKVGDKIIAIDDISVETKNDIYEILGNKSKGETINIEVIKDDETKNRSAQVVEYEGRNLIGITITEDVDYNISSNINFNFSDNESGPSGGLAMTLAIYSSLTNTDVTNGKNVVATGTIDTLGNVGTIGGVKYKLLGAVKNNADVFIVPNAENYEEALEVNEEYNCDIEIVGVNTFEEALEYLLND